MLYFTRYLNNFYLWSWIKKKEKKRKNPCFTTVEVYIASRFLARRRILIFWPIEAAYSVDIHIIYISNHIKNTENQPSMFYIWDRALRSKSNQTRPCHYSLSLIWCRWICHTLALRVCPSIFPVSKLSSLLGGLFLENMNIFSWKLTVCNCYR